MYSGLGNTDNGSFCIFRPFSIQIGKLFFSALSFERHKINKLLACMHV